MRHAIRGCFATMLCVAPSFAMADDPTRVALDIGGILGAAKLCGVQLNASAVSGYINEHVNASNMSFMNDLSTFTSVSRRELLHASKDEFVLRCMQVHRNVVYYKFGKSKTTSESDSPIPACMYGIRTAFPDVSVDAAHERCVKRIYGTTNDPRKKRVQ